MYALLLELLKPFPVLMWLAGAMLAILWRRCPEQRTWRRAAAIVYALLLLDSLPLTARLTAGWLEHRFPRVITRPEGTRVIVVLGAGVVPPQAAGEPARPDAGSLARALRGWELYRDGPPCPILLTGGGRPGGVPAAEAMAGFLRQAGVPEQDLLVESQSWNTAENAEFSLQMLRERGIDDGVVLVSSASHLWRAERLFRNRGAIVTPVGCDYTAERIPLTWSLFWPSGTAISMNQMAWHEYLGAAWLWLRGRW
uniref:YdcF family protein n=1 Tax=Schlesneria paludicola TaxID=360056 RepID=A0A7C2P4G9_9PLAN